MSVTGMAGHGISGPEFDVVIPSLPGYGFSSRPAVLAAQPQTCCT
jgi:hypothetical protein